MNNKEIQKQILENAAELSKLLDDRITELYQLAGAAQGQFFQGARHTFCYYRNFVWKIRDLAEQINKCKD